MTELIYKKESYAIVGACFDVYNEKGCGFLELKTVSKLIDEHRAQILNYLNATGFELGLLVNFEHYPDPKHERVVITQPGDRRRMLPIHLFKIRVHLRDSRVNR